MDLKASLLAVADAYAADRGVSKARVATQAANDGKFFKILESGGSCTIATYERLMRWFSAHWPDGLTWPEGVGRPVPTMMEAAGTTQAGHIISRFGGLTPLSRACGVEEAVVQGWKKRGTIPPDRYGPILDMGRFLDPPLEMRELVEDRGGRRHWNLQPSEPRQPRSGRRLPQPTRRSGGTVTGGAPEDAPAAVRS